MTFPLRFDVRAPTDGLNGTTMGDMNSASGHLAPISPGLVPELLITDLAASLNFWVTLCGFEILYDRPKEVSRIFTPERRTSCSSRSESVEIGSLALSTGHSAAV